MTEPAIDLRLGNWQDALADVGRVDHLITDPPFSSRTHKGQMAARRDRGKAAGFVSSTGLGYDAMTPEMIGEFVDAWSNRVRGWICVFTSHDLIPVYETALRAAGRYVFAPLACVIPGMNVRLVGDGPSNWCLPLIVSRPLGMSKWGTLPGAYIAKRERLPQGQTRVPGQKPLELMQRIVDDYSEPGDLICDPFAGSGTTLVAAAMKGRRGIGAERDETRHALASTRVAVACGLPLPASTIPQPEPVGGSV